MKVGERLVKQRGTWSASLTHTDTSEVLTPEGFSDLATPRRITERRLTQNDGEGS